MNRHHNPFQRHITYAINLTLVIVLIILFLLAGCTAPPAPAKEPAASTTELRGVPPHNAAAMDPSPDHALRQPDNAVASAGTVDVLARKTEAYSREIEPMIARRPLPQQPSASTSLPPASASRAPQDSSVDWADPNALRLTDFPGSPLTESDRQLPVRPAIQTSPTEVNQVASAAESTSPHADLAAANVPAMNPSEVVNHAQPTNRMMDSTSDQLMDKLSRRVRENPRDVSGHLEYQLLQFLLDEQVPQLAALATLPSEDRELLTAFLDGLMLFRNTLRSDNNMLLSRKIRPLLDMSDRLRSQADLVIPTIELCSSVNGFGKYEPIEPARFAAGADHRAVIYCEIANFSSNLNAEKMWETQLKQDITLYTEGGIAVWSDKTETINDSARVRRQDFFINKRIVIPANLTIGRYILKVTVVDVQANRVAEASVPIVIAAK